MYYKTLACCSCIFYLSFPLALLWQIKTPEEYLEMNLIQILNAKVHNVALIMEEPQKTALIVDPTVINVIYRECLMETHVIWQIVWGMQKL